MKLFFEVLDEGRGWLRQQTCADGKCMAVSSFALDVSSCKPLYDLCEVAWFDYVPSQGVKTHPWVKPYEPKVKTSLQNLTSARADLTEMPAG